MKNSLVVLTVLSIVSSLALAGNGYCDSRPSRREQQDCYQNAIESNVSLIKQNYQFLMASPKLTQQQKQQLQNDQAAWGNKVDGYCNGNLMCLYESTASRYMYLAGMASRK
ncbi:lysozyme inhibitor LprI family protein [Herbaspirillum sp. VT-16-41]|uniref:lysozyme inhibitor LprI family protein n=1 Tax=Herbaspirillum sp. VT-16-41 TaxID=1953765 RepID=UPI000980EBD3|nr:lysozyme inhibitor LprI family protein [Herbaspirillum sp. VT-16-41]ONN64979.1 hypothetical protein BTM36_19350 [Herbaspirillum sp. VT-16-41]